MAVIPLLARDSGASIAAAVGDRLCIALSENPTTGYRWQPRSPTLLLGAVGDEYAPAADAGIGGGGTRTLLYEAIAAGRGRLELELRRAWEPAETPLGTFGIELEIGEAGSR